MSFFLKNYKETNKPLSKEEEMRHTVFLFGEAEKGAFCTPKLCESAYQLAEKFGNPPKGSEGLPCGIQMLLYNRLLIYFRVKEEGFSLSDYKQGLKMLKNPKAFPKLSAICMPGIGDADIIKHTIAICFLYQSIFVTSQKDLYDFLTSHAS
mgnify:FL=1